MFKLGASKLKHPVSFSSPAWHTVLKRSLVFLSFTHFCHYVIDSNIVYNHQLFLLTYAVAVVKYESFFTVLKFYHIDLDKTNEETH